MAVFSGGRLAGIAYLSVDGVSYMLSGELSYGVSTIERKTLIGQDGVQGYSETPKAGFIAGTLRDAGNLTVADFNAMTGNTVTVELANGKMVSGGNMWTVEAQEVKSMEGTFEVRWEGLLVQEIQ